MSQEEMLFWCSLAAGVLIPLIRQVLSEAHEVRYTIKGGVKPTINPDVEDKSRG